MSSFYSGFISLGESLLKPTKSLFGGPSKPDPKQSISEKPSNKSTSRMSIKFFEEEDEDNSLEYPDHNENFLTLPKHKTGLSTSTAASQHSPVKTQHTYKKSIALMIGEEGVDSISLHDGELSAVQTTEAPLLFAKGGYDSHIDSKGLKSNDAKKSISSTKRKGGFVILENNKSPDLSHTRKFSTPQARLGGSFNFFSKQGDIGFSTASRCQTEEAVEEDDVVDPLSSARVPVARVQTRVGSMSHKRIPSNLSIAISEINADGEIVRPSLATTKEKRNITTIWEDYENQDIQDLVDLGIPAKVPQTTKNQQLANPFLDFSYHENSNSRHDSVIINGDQNSEFDLDFGDDMNVSSILQPENPVNQVKDKLIQEYKEIQKQYLSLNGIYVIPTSDSFVWNCLVFIRGGYYENGKFKFEVQIPDTYPSGNIQVYAKTKVYHPLINIETGELDLKLCDQKGDNKIAKILTFIKMIFNDSKYLEKQTSFNQEAGSKFSQNPYYFKVKAKESVKATQKNNLNEKTDTATEILNRADSVKELVTAAAKDKTNFDDKVQNLIASIKQKVKAN